MPHMAGIFKVLLQWCLGMHRPWAQVLSFSRKWSDNSSKFKLVGKSPWVNGVAGKWQMKCIVFTWASALNYASLAYVRLFRSYCGPKRWRKCLKMSEWKRSKDLIQVRHCAFPGTRSVGAAGKITGLGALWVMKINHFGPTIQEKEAYEVTIGVHRERTNVYLFSKRYDMRQREHLLNMERRVLFMACF